MYKKLQIKSFKRRYRSSKSKEALLNLGLLKESSSIKLKNNYLQFFSKDTNRQTRANTCLMLTLISITFFEYFDRINSLNLSFLTGFRPFDWQDFLRL
jgi:hypothetical protein